MRILLVFFLACFALAASSPLYDADRSEWTSSQKRSFLALLGGLAEFEDDFDFLSEDKPTLEEVKERLREKFNNFLQKIRDALKGGKDIKDEILSKGKEIKEKFKLLKEQLDKDGKDFLEKLLDHGREYLKHIFGKLGVNDKQDVDYHVEAIMQAEEKDDIINKLKDKFQDVVKKVKDAIEQGKNLKDGLETLEKIRQKLKEFNIDLGDFGNEYLEQLKEKVKDYWKKLKDRLGVGKRSEDNIDVFGMVQELKKLINEEFNTERIKAFVEKYFGENKEVIESITQFIKENGKENFEKLRDFVKKLVREMISAHSKRSCDDVFEEIREFFKDLGIDIKERFTKFGEWVREQYNKGLEKSKNRLDNIKIIANEFTKKIPVELAEETLDFFRHYKTHLGDVFDDIEDKVKEILKQE